MTKSRKDTMNDIRVIAAIEALNTAVLAVNGDAKVVSSWVYFDIKTADGHGVAALRMNICPCDLCLNHASQMLTIALADARKNPQRQSGRRVH